MLLLLKIIGILGLVFCLFLFAVAIKLRKLNSKKFYKKTGLILAISLVLVGFSQFKIHQKNQIQRATYTISSKSTLEESQTFLRVLIFSNEKKDIENIFKILQKKEKKEGVDSLFVRFNVDNGGEIGKFVANGKVAWSKKGEEQVNLKQNQVKIEYNQEK